MLVSIALNPTILFLDIYVIDCQESVHRTRTKKIFCCTNVQGRERPEITVCLENGTLCSH